MIACIKRHFPPLKLRASDRCGRGRQLRPASQGLRLLGLATYTGGACFGLYVYTRVADINTDVGATRGSLSCVVGGGPPTAQIILKMLQHGGSYPVSLLDRLLGCFQIRHLPARITELDAEGRENASRCLMHPFPHEIPNHLLTSSAHRALCRRERRDTLSPRSRSWSPQTAAHP